MKIRTLAVIVGLGACISSSAGEDDDQAAGSSGAGGSGGGAPDYQSSVHLGQAELSRRAGHLASDALDGRDEGTPGGELARTFLVDEMKACGIEPAVGDSYLQPVTTGTGVNVLGIVRGRDAARAERTIIVSAHYDHLGHCDGAICNGADDNAAGVAIVLGVGCALAANPPARSVMIAAWDAEEPPTFLTEQMGSRFYAQNPVVPLDRTDAVLVLDLVGGDLWPGSNGHFVLGAELSPALAAAVDATAVPDGLFTRRLGLHLAEEQPIGHQPWSDYDAFRNLGVPFLFFSNGQNERYHTPADEMAMINMPKVELEARYLVGIVERLANAEETPTFAGEGSDYALDAAHTKLLLERALAPGGLIESLGLSLESRTKLEADLADATAIEAKLAGGATPTTQEIRRLRDGIQHMMCYAAPYYDEATCNLF